MNRHIIFRAKTLKDGEWVQGVPIKTHIGTFVVTEENPHICNVYGYMEIDEFSKVNPDTLGQYTNVDDKNGKRIFEGDIVRIHCNMGYDKLGVVGFKDGCFRVYNESEWRKFHPLNLTSEEEHDMGARIEFEYTFEVLGNIFDDSQILAN